MARYCEEEGHEKVELAADQWGNIYCPACYEEWHAGGWKKWEKEVWIE